jgi:hypothetical protein
MGTIRTQASHEIDARPDAIYNVLADYRTGHPAILPKPYFSDLIVEAGGRGAGTIIRFTMNVLGTQRTFREVVSEPQPGHVLVETDEAAGVTTTFTVDPLDGGKRARVTITTETPASPGLRGLVERVLNPRILADIYRKELRQLDAYTKETTA